MSDERSATPRSPLPRLRVQFVRYLGQDWDRLSIYPIFSIFTIFSIYSIYSNIGKIGKIE